MRLLYAFLILVLMAVAVAPQVSAQGRGNSSDNDDDYNDRREDPPRRSTRVPPVKRVTVAPVTTTRPVRVQPRQNTVIAPTKRIVTRTAPPEHIAIVRSSEADLAAIALTAAGASVLRRRDYPNLDRHALIVDLQSVTLEQARLFLTSVAPGATLDLHALYGYAKGSPRLYAAALVGQSGGPDCVLPANIRIGLIDGPVETSHPALRGASLTSHSVLGQSKPPRDKDHGTAVAALLVGQDATGALAGFATGAHLFAASAFSRAAASDASDVERIGAALDWLAGERVQLINMSFAGPVNQALGSLLNASADQGTILIAAAGNGGSSQPVYPAAAAPVISVTAVDAALKLYRQANTGDYIEFAAPGVDLYVANHKDGGYASGTSFAAPILTGLAARLVADGASTVADLRGRLQAQSIDLGDSGRDAAFGWGMVKASGC